MKRIYQIFLLILACLLSLSACSAKNETQSGTNKPIILGFSQLGSESGWRIGNSNDIEAAAKRHGVQLMFKNADQKQENQIKAIRSFIAYRVDVIAFAPIVEEGWENVLKEAQEAGIPVLCSDRSVKLEDNSLIAGFVGSDFYQEGCRAGEFLLKKCEGIKGPVRIVEISGTLDSTPMRQRALGFRDVLKGDSRFDIIKSISGDFLRSMGKECMAQVLNEQAEIDVLYSHNDAMTLGAIEAIEKKGIKPGQDIIIITVDGEQGAIDMLKAGKINCVVECTPKIGDLIMNLSKALVRGETIAPVTYTHEEVFSEFDINLEKLSPRGY